MFRILVGEILQHFLKELRGSGYGLVFFERSVSECEFSKGLVYKGVYTEVLLFGDVFDSVLDVLVYPDSPRDASSIRVPSRQENSTNVHHKFRLLSASRYRMVTSTVAIYRWVYFREYNRLQYATSMSTTGYTCALRRRGRGSNLENTIAEERSRSKANICLDPRSTRQVETCFLAQGSVPELCADTGNTDGGVLETS